MKDPVSIGALWHDWLDAEAGESKVNPRIVKAIPHRSTRSPAKMMVA